MISQKGIPLAVGLTVLFNRWDNEDPKNPKPLPTYGVITDLIGENPSDQSQGTVEIKCEDGKVEQQPALSVEVTGPRSKAPKAESAPAKSKAKNAKVKAGSQPPAPAPTPA